jgi:aminodeoxyfutalosine deaminase
MNATETIARMPKAELHLHLEGTIGPETLWAIAQRNQVALPVGSLAELRRLYAFEGFDKFLHLWLAMCRCLQREADYALMVDAFADECRRQNIRYVEAHFTPYNHERFGFGARRALATVTRRIEDAERQGGPVIRLITDIPSESVPESGPFTVQLLEEESHPLIVAVGLGGPEEGYPRRLVEEHFARARDAGYPVVAHAGETAGAAHVREAVEHLKARRIQHGVRAVEDPATLALLAERDVCCDVCLTSNTFLTVYRDLGTHPLKRMMAAGVPVTLGTDDPPFFGTDLVREYTRAHLELGLSLETLWQLDLNGLRYGLAETPLRRRLMKEFVAAGQALGLGPPAA